MLDVAVALGLDCALSGGERAVSQSSQFPGRDRGRGAQPRGVGVEGKEDKEATAQPHSPQGHATMQLAPFRIWSSR